MSLTNSNANYGSVAKGFHWMTAFLILTALPLGIIAQELPFETDAELTMKATVFSAHKTIGVLAFFTALLRILWALTQKRPGLLNAENKLEATAAETAHWLLYGSMLAVPLTGWIHHAATEGFAPIWLPFGQNLPFVPESEAVAGFTASLHYLLVIVMALTILAHIGGALKHFIIDKDQTLHRMLPGSRIMGGVATHTRHLAPPLLALAVWAIAMGVGTFGGMFKPHTQLVEVAELAEVTSDWSVLEGQLGLEITQFGSPVSGEFTDWTAQISFEEEAVDGKNGETTVEIAIGSMTLGSVTQQAMGADFFDVATFPTAVFNADIVQNPDGDNQYSANGTLTVKGISMPLTLPFVLELNKDVAVMAGSVSLDRRDFSVGNNLPDESNLGFGVNISVSLTATRNPTE